MWYDFGKPDLKPFFGAVYELPGVSVKVNLVTGQTSRLSIVLNMSVINKSDLSKGSGSLT